MGPWAELTGGTPRATPARTPRTSARTGSARLPRPGTRGYFRTHFADPRTGGNTPVAGLTATAGASDSSFLVAGDRAAAFASGATDLVPDDTNGAVDVFVRRGC